MNDLFGIISNITKSENNLMFRSIGELKKCYMQNQLILKFDRDKLIGFVIRKDLSEKYVEIGCLYVAKAYRGKGIGGSLIVEALGSIRDKRIFVRTKEKSLKNFFVKNGFKPVCLKKDWEITILYLKDRLSHPQKIGKFLKSINCGSCAYVFEAHCLR